MMDAAWFNVGFGQIGRFKLFNLFHRVVNTGQRFWGIGVCQYKRRHFFFVGTSGISILWIGKTR